MREHLKQLALAAHSFHDTYQAFPLASYTPSTGQVQTGTRKNPLGKTVPVYTTEYSPNGYVTEYIPLLPYLEQGNLYQQLYDVAMANNTFMGDAQYSATTSGVLSATPLPILVCPSDQLPSPPISTYQSYYVGVTSYVGNLGGSSQEFAGNDGIFIGSTISAAPVSILGITDGTSNTILFGERYNFDPLWNTSDSSLGNTSLSSLFGTTFCGFFSPWGSSSAILGGPQGWGYVPLNYTFVSGNINLSLRGHAYGSGHTQGANFVFCDGSVHSSAMQSTTRAWCPRRYRPIP